MYASTLLVTALSLVGFVAAQTSSAANPFTSAGIPDLSTLGICTTQCATVAQVDNNWNGDYSQLCTANFSTSLTTCIQCVATSAVGALVLTPSNEQTLESAIQNYETQCQQSGSPVTINISSILEAATSGAATATTNHTGTATGNSAPTNTTGGASVGRNLSRLGIAGLAGLIAVVGYSLSL